MIFFHLAYKIIDSRQLHQKPYAMAHNIFVDSYQYEMITLWFENTILQFPLIPIDYATHHTPWPCNLW